MSDETREIVVARIRERIPHRSEVYVTDEPATLAAHCERCGWHTRPYRNLPLVERLALGHVEHCPNPPPPRYGATAECGDWCYAAPGAQAGRSTDRCPTHGDVLLVTMNVAEPVGTALSAHWTAPTELSYPGGSR